LPQHVDAAGHARPATVQLAQVVGPAILPEERVIEKADMKTPDDLGPIVNVDRRAEKAQMAHPRAARPKKEMRRANAHHLTHVVDAVPTSSAPRSCSTPLDQRNGWLGHVGQEVAERPVTWPASLTSSATLKSPPSVPKSVMLYESRQRGSNATSWGRKRPAATRHPGKR